MLILGYGLAGRELGARWGGKGQGLTVVGRPLMCTVPRSTVCALYWPCHPDYWQGARGWTRSVGHWHPLRSVKIFEESPPWGHRNQCSAGRGYRDPLDLDSFFPVSWLPIPKYLFCQFLSWTGWNDYVVHFLIVCVCVCVRVYLFVFVCLFVCLNNTMRCVWFTSYFTVVTNPKNTRVIYKHTINSVLPVVPVISERDLHGFASTISDALAICTKARTVLEKLQEHGVCYCILWKYIDKR